MRRYPLRTALVALCLALLLAGAAWPAGIAGADPQPETRPGPTRLVRAGDEPVATLVPPPASPDGPRLAAAQFEVSYNGFSPEAQAVFQYAVNIWAAQLSSPMPIRVRASWEPLGTG